jgi:hypothetical protein
VYEVIFYEDKDGNKPVELFIDQLEAMATSNKNARVLLESIIYCLDRLENGGTRCGSRFTKQIRGKIWEVRPREIEIAEKRMNDWIKRFGSDGK